MSKRWSEWIPWSGGACPVDGNVKCEVKYRNGEIEGSYRALIWSWNHTEEDDDIIAYRYELPETERTKVEYRAELPTKPGWYAGINNVYQSKHVAGIGIPTFTLWTERDIAIGWLIATEPLQIEWPEPTPTPDELQTLAELVKKYGKETIVKQLENNDGR